MRVAFITNLAPHYRKPFYELLSQRHDVDFFFFAQGGERYFNAKLSHQNGSFRTRPVKRYSLAGEPIMPGLARVLAPDSYDVVVKCLNGRLMVPSTVAIARLRGLPLVIWTGMWYHPNTPFHRATRPLTESVYRSADAILAYGEHVKRFVSAVPGVAPEKVFVAGQAVEAERFLAADPAISEPAEFIYVGQFEERKGLDVLLDAHASLPSGLAKLTLVGSGSLEDDLRRRAPAGSGVEIVGQVPQERLPDYLSQARALILPSITTRQDKEPWGLVVNEAMHAGIPAVVTDAVGAAAGGLVEDGRNGRVVPERDPTALAEAMRSLATQPDTASRMGRAARKDVARFNYESMAEAFTAAMNYAVEQRAGRRG